MLKTALKELSIDEIIALYHRNEETIKRNEETIKRNEKLLKKLNKQLKEKKLEREGNNKRK